MRNPYPDLGYFELTGPKGSVQLARGVALDFTNLNLQVKPVKRGDKAFHDALDHLLLIAKKAYVLSHKVDYGVLEEKSFIFWGLGNASGCLRSLL